MLYLILRKLKAGLGGLWLIVASFNFGLLNGTWLCRSYHYVPLESAGLQINTNTEQEVVIERQRHVTCIAEVIVIARPVSWKNQVCGRIFKINCICKMNSTDYSSV